MIKFIKSVFSSTNLLCLVLLFNVLFSGFCFAAGDKEIILDRFNQYYNDVYNAKNYEKYDKVTQKFGSRNIVTMSFPPNVDKKILNLSFIKLVKPVLIPTYEIELESISIEKNIAKIVYHNKYDKNTKLYAKAIKEEDEWKFDKSYIIAKDENGKVNEAKSIAF